MQQLRYRLIIPCISFTMNIIILLLFSMLQMPIGWGSGVDNMSLFQLLALHVAVSLGIYIVDCILPRDSTGNFFWGFISTLLIVLFLGGIAFKLFPLDWFPLLIITLMVLLIYGVVCWLMFRMNKHDAERINKKIKERDND